VNSVKTDNEALTHRVYLWTSDFTVAVQFLSLEVIMDFWNSILFIWSLTY